MTLNLDRTLLCSLPRLPMRREHLSRLLCSLLFGWLLLCSAAPTWATAPVWTNKTPPGAPPTARTFFGMADEGNGKILLFGGYDGNSTLGDTWEWDKSANGGTGAWSQKNPVTSPPARQRYQLAAAGNGKILLFGGYDGNSLLGNTWEWDGTANGGNGTWTQKTTPAALTPRQSSAMASEGGGKVLLFGGRSSAGYLNETWEWDGTANGGNGTWTQKTTPSGLAARTTAMAGEASGKILLFGGSDPTANSPGTNNAVSDTWEWDGAANNNTGAWTQKAPSTQPSARYNHAMALDSNGKVLLFGGQDGAKAASQSNIVDDNDTWEWDSSANNWTLLSPGTSPPIRAAYGMAYDSVNQQVVLFGGGDNSTKLNDTWLWNGSNWTAVPAPNYSNPATRSQLGMADEGNGKLLLFGGSNGTYLGDTWEWDGTANNGVGTWTQKTPSPAPVGRQLPVMASEGNGKVLLFGGSNVSGLLGDTWEWNSSNSTWTQKMPQASPTARQLTAMVSLGNGHVLLFGGADGSHNYLNDTWEWDGSNWNQKTPATSPPIRNDHAMAAESGGKVLLFGGEPNGGGFASDTWEWDGSNWTQKTPTTHPGGRSSHRMTYDSTRTRVVLFGGQNGSGTYLNDTWEWNGTNWYQVPSSGPAGRTETAMDYDATLNSVVLFGGSPGNVPLNDTWQYGGGTAPYVVSSTLVDPSPHAPGTVHFTVTFSEAVTGLPTSALPTSAFVLTTGTAGVPNATGITGASVTGVTDNGNGSYAVTVNTGTGTGTLRLDLAANGSVTDIYGHPLMNNGSYTGGAAYTITAPDLSATQIDNVNQTTSLGSNWTWTIHVANGGSAAATFTTGQNIVLDNLPDTNISYGTPAVGNIKGTITGTISPSIGTVNNNDLTLTALASGGSVTLAPNSSFDITFTATASAPGTFTNPRANGSASVDPANVVVESNESNNTIASDTVTVTAPDLTATKTDNVSGTTPFGIFWTWTIHVVNTGGVATFTNGQNLVLDNLPDTNISYGTPTIANATGVTGTISPSIGTVNTNDLTLTATASGSVTLAATSSFDIVFTATPSAPGTFTNPRATGTATVDPDNLITESNENNNSFSDSVTVTAPDLTLTKTDDVSGTVIQGTPWTWKLHIANVGNAPATFTTGQNLVLDNLPTNLSYGTPAIANATGITGTGTISSSIASNDLTATANGGSVIIAGGGSFDITFTATPSTIGTFANPRANGRAKVDPDGDITESDETNNTDSDSVIVVGQPTADSQTVPVVFNTATAVTLTASDPNTTPTQTPLTYNVPATTTKGGTLSGTAPNLTYTPATGFNGTDSFTFTVTNKANVISAPATVTLNVSIGQPTADAQTVPVAFNTATAVTLTASDPNSNPAQTPLTYNVPTTTTKSGTLSGTAPNLTYTPASGFNGTDSFTFTVTNKANAISAPATVTLNVSTGTPTADAQTLAVTFNTATTVTLTASDPNTTPAQTPLTYNAPTTTTKGGTLSGTAPNLTYTPATGFNGSDSFTFTVTNQANVTSAAATVTLNVSIGKPTADAQTVAVAFNTATAVTLTANDPNSNPAQTPLTYNTPTITAQGGTLTGTAPNLTYHPATGFNGTDSFTFTVTNQANVTSAAATVTLNVSPGTPTAGAQSVATNQNAPANIILTGSDPDTDPALALTYAITVNPTHGTLSNFDAATGHVTYTPDSQFHSTDNFQFTLSNGTNTSPAATVSLTVNYVNQTPTLDPLNAQSVLENSSAKTLNLSGISAGPGDSGQTLTVTATSDNLALIPNPTVSYNSPDATGTLTYTPTANHFGTATITVTVQDNGGTARGAVDTVTQTFQVTVTHINQTPTLNAIPNPAAILEDAATQTVNLSGISAGLGDAGQIITVTATSDNPTLIPNPAVTYTSPKGTGTLTYAPAADANGTATITVTVQDNGGTTNGGVDTITRTFVVNVTAVNDAPVNLFNGGATFTAQTTTENTPIVFDAAHANRLTVADVDAGANPIQVTLAATNGTLALGSTANLNFTAGGNNSATMTFTGTISAINAALNGLSFVPATNANGGASLTITTNDLGNTGVGGPLSATNTVPITITATARTLAISSAQGVTGSTPPTPAVFTVTLSAASAQPVTVQYATADNTALAGSDYTAASGTLTFAPGETTKTISVAVLTTTTPGADKTFVVNLSSPSSGVNLATPQGIGTIHNTAPPITPPASGAVVSVSFSNLTSGDIYRYLPSILGTVSETNPPAGANLTVQVSFQRGSDHKFFNGVSWVSAPVFFPATVANGVWILPYGLLPTNANGGPALADGQYTLTAQAGDGLGNDNGHTATSTVTLAIDHTAPTLTITTPKAGAVVHELNAIGGKTSDATGGTGVAQVVLQLVRVSDGAFFDGTHFVSRKAKGGVQPTSLTTVLDRGSGVWARRHGLPSRSELAPGTYRIAAVAVDGAGNRAQATSSFSVPSAPPVVALSTATASVATSSLRLRFLVALEAESASDAAHYTVAVNGKQVTVESAGYNAATHTVTLSLPDGSLKVGAKVSAQFSGLQDSAGHAIAGQTETIIAH